MTNRKTLRHCATALLRRCLWRVVRRLNRETLLSRAESELRIEQDRCADLRNERDWYAEVATRNHGEILRLREINERLRAIIRERRSSPNNAVTDAKPSTDAEAAGHRPRSV